MESGHMPDSTIAILEEVADFYSDGGGQIPNWAATLYPKFSAGGNSGTFCQADMVSIGPISTEALQAYGIAPDMEPIHPKMGQLVFETAAKAKVLEREKRAQFG